MWVFYTSKKWALWAYLGTFFILGTLWLQVQVDVQINHWFGDFYDLIQKALATPGSVTIGEY